MEPESKEIVFRYNEKFSSDLVTGFIGGFATNGTLSIDFFRDKLTLPSKIEVELKDNKFIKEISVEGGKHINRDILFEAVIDLQTAKALIGWLLDQVSQFESLQSQQ